MIYWIYAAVIRSGLTYAGLVRWDRAQLKTNKSILDKIQRLVALSITGAMRTTPTRNLDTILDLSPLHIYLRSRARLMAYILHIRNMMAKQYIMKGYTEIFRDISEN